MMSQFFGYPVPHHSVHIQADMTAQNLDIMNVVVLAFLPGRSPLGLWFYLF